jgi:serine/threonine-protein kinase
MDEAQVIAECEARVGTLLSGKWQLDHLIGIGASAAVYAARSEATAAAVKILHSSWTSHATIRARFQREAYIGNTIDHPGIVRVLEDGTSDAGELYLVMDLLVGASLDLFIDQHRGVVPTLDALWIVDGILSVLERAHAIDIVHRDLKPENVFLTDQGVVKVLDFGIARLRESRKDSGFTVEGMVMGTPTFMPHEQALGRWSQLDARADIWSVGAILFTLLTGRYVHGDATGNEMLIRAATRKAPALSSVIDAAPELCALVDKALAFDPKRRFDQAGSMRRAVQDLLQVPDEAPASVRSTVDSSPMSVPRSLSPADLTARVAAESVVDLGFARSVIAAYHRAESRGAPSRVTEAVRAGLRRLAEDSPDAALELILTLFDEFDASRTGIDADARRAFASAVVSTKALGALLANAGRPGVDPRSAARALTLVLELLGDAHAGVALDALRQDPRGSLRDLLIDYVARSGQGYEEPLAALLPAAEESFALVLLSILDRMRTDAARLAIERAKESPHRAVRVQAELLQNGSRA